MTYGMQAYIASGGARHRFYMVRQLIQSKKNSTATVFPSTCGCLNEHLVLVRPEIAVGPLLFLHPGPAFHSPPALMDQGPAQGSSSTGSTRSTSCCLLPCSTTSPVTASRRAGGCRGWSHQALRGVPVHPPRSSRCPCQYIGSPGASGSGSGSVPLRRGCSVLCQPTCCHG
jgi:hypothetical protein